MRSCGIVRENLKSVSLLVARDIGLVLDVGSRRLGTCYFLSISLHYFQYQISLVVSHCLFLLGLARGTSSCTVVAV